MDLRRRLQTIHDRVSNSARELELQPEVFQATEELRIAAGDLAEVIRDLSTDKGSTGAPGGSDAQAKEGSPGRLVPLRPKRQDPADHGTNLAPGRDRQLAA